MPEISTQTPLPLIKEYPIEWPNPEEYLKDQWFCQECKAGNHTIPANSGYIDEWGTVWCRNCIWSFENGLCGPPDMSFEEYENIDGPIEYFGIVCSTDPRSFSMKNEKWPDLPMSRDHPKPIIKKKTWLTLFKNKESSKRIVSWADHCCDDRN
tara:strand:- start:1687 stop:2145 length:459 start_codon:yes stop_codon:yes gene_type:complete